MPKPVYIDQVISEREVYRCFPFIAFCCVGIVGRAPIRIVYIDVSSKVAHHCTHHTFRPGRVDIVRARNCVGQQAHV